MLMPLARRPMLGTTVVLLAVVLIIRGVWGWHAQRLFDAEVARIRAAGQPVWSAEHVFEAVPDEENAWPLQVQAGTITMTSGADCPAATNATYREYPPFSVDWIRTAAPSEQANAAAFTLARRARERERGQVITALPSSYKGIATGNLNVLRNLANTVGDGAIFQHLQGHDVEALERCRDVLHLSRSLRTLPLWINQLVAIGTDALACARIQAIAPGLRLGDAATRDATRALIADLLDESSIRRGFEESFMGERSLLIGQHEDLTAETFFLDPAAKVQTATAMQVMGTWLAASKLENAVDVRAAMTGVPQMKPIRPVFLWRGPSGGIPRYSRWFDIVVSSGERYAETYFRVKSDRRMTAVILALQLYRDDHGRWPERLEELVPAYLHALPRDPFSPSGAAIGYVVLKGACPDGSDRPLVYVDHGDANNVLQDEPMIGWQGDPSDIRPRREYFRQYRDVSRWMPATLRKETWPALPPALRQQRVDGDPQVAEGPGEEAEAEE
jgi:hypothetical protein